MEHTAKKSLRILVLAGYDPEIEWIQFSLQEQNYDVLGQVLSVREAWEAMQQTEIDIILADSSGEGVLDPQWIQSLLVQSKRSLVLVSASSLEMDFVREAMLAGASGFLLKPFEPAELSRSIDQAYQLWLQRNALLAETAAEGQSARAAAVNKAPSIAVFSPKGGTGSTTLAVNLAVALKQQTDTPVLLVDADLRTADVDIFLSIFSRRSLLDLMALDQRLDRDLLGQVITEHASGIMALRGDPQLQFVDTPFEAGQVGHVIEGILSTWDGYVVINTSNGLDRWTVEILDAVETILVVTTPELPALRVTRNFLELAEATADNSGRWQVIMNAYKGKKVLQTADIEASIHYPIMATIAEDNTLVSTSINRGTPLITSQRKSIISQDIMALAEQLLETRLSPAQSLSADDTQSRFEEKTRGRSTTSNKRFSFWNTLTNSVRLTMW